MSQIQKKTIKSGVKAGYFLTITFGSFFLASLVAVFSTQEWESLKASILTFIILAYFFLYFLGGAVELDGENLTIRKYFLIKRKIILTSIYDWKIKIGVENYFDRFKPTVRLEIYSKDPDRTTCIPIKTYKKENADKIFEILDNQIETST